MLPYSPPPFQFPIQQEQQQQQQQQQHQSSDEIPQTPEGLLRWSIENSTPENQAQVDNTKLMTHEEFKETCRRLNEMYGSQYTLDSFKKIITKGFRFKPSTAMVDMIMFYVSKFVYVYLKQLGVESEEYKDFLMDMLGVRFDGESQWEENMQRLVTESEKRLGYFQEGLRKTDETAEDRGTSCH